MKLKCSCYNYFKLFYKYLLDITEKFIADLKQSNSKKLKIPESISIGAGFELSDTEHKNFIPINFINDFRRGHLFCFGTTGSGKSRLIEIMVEQDIRNGHNVVIIDPKIDNGLISRAYQTCVQCNRMNDFMFLSALYPSLSIKINPASNYFTIDEIINHTVASVPANDPFFYAIAIETTSAIVHSIIIIRRETNNKKNINFYDIYSYISHTGLNKLKAELEVIMEKPTKTPKSDIENIHKLLENVLSSPMEYFGKVTTTLRTTLTQLTTGAVGKIIGNAESNPFIDRLDNDKGVVLYVQTPSMLSKMTSDTLSKTVLSMIQSCIGRRSILNNPFKNPVSLYIDEASNSLYMGSENLFNKSRSANVMISAFSQSFADIDDAVGKEKAKMILGNTNAKMFLRLVDIDTAKKVAEYGGESVQYSSMVSTQNLMMREETREILNGKMFLDLQPREFFYFGLEGNFKGKVAKVDQCEIQLTMPAKGFY